MPAGWGRAPSDSSWLRRLWAPRAWLLRLTAFGLGAGSFGYSLYWMWAGFRAPGLGGTGLAKESLKWLAMPSSGAVVLCTGVVLGVLFAALFRRSVPE